MKASERIGMLSKMLTRANSYLRDEHETIRRVKGALTYPAIMISFAILTTTFLLAFVMPKFTAIYASRGAALPVPTRILMAMSGCLVTNWPWIVGGVIVAAVAGRFYVQTQGGKRQWNWLQLRIPLMGGLFRKLHLSRGMRMIGTMAGAGVGLVDCVATANELCDNVYFRELWDEVSDKIQAGKQMSEPLSQSALVPRSIAQMINSGRLLRAGTQRHNQRTHAIHRTADDRRHGLHHRRRGPGADAAYFYDQPGGCAMNSLLRPHFSFRPAGRSTVRTAIRHRYTSPSLKATIL
jgi:type IV pilus assembly protein PilC